MGYDKKDSVIFLKQIQNKAKESVDCIPSSTNHVESYSLRKRHPVLGR